MIHDNIYAVNQEKTKKKKKKFSKSVNLFLFYANLFFILKYKFLDF